MSQTEEKQEENVDTEKAVNLFGALSTFFKLDPKGVIGLIHEASEDIVDRVTGSEDLKKELGFSAGQLKLLSHFFWYFDDKNVVQQAIANPENLEDVMDAVTELAEAYKMLNSDGAKISDIESLISRAVANLSKVIEYIIGTADCDP